MNTCPLANPTKQQVFDFGLKKIVEQGKAAVFEGSNNCTYRTPGGLRCIVGHMLGDDVDYHRIASMPVGAAVKQLPAEYGWMRDPGMLEFLRQLQTCHDAAHLDTLSKKGDFVSCFKERMRKVAEMHNLEYKELA